LILVHDYADATDIVVHFLTKIYISKRQFQTGFHAVLFFFLCRFLIWKKEEFWGWSKQWIKMSSYKKGEAKGLKKWTRIKPMPNLKKGPCKCQTSKNNLLGFCCSIRILVFSSRKQYLSWLPHEYFERTQSCQWLKAKLQHRIQLICQLKKW